MAIKKIYVYNKPIILTNEAERYSLENPNTVHYLFLKGNDSSNFRTALTHLEQANSYGVVLENKDVDELLSGFKKAFKNVVAAGGIVLSADDSLLMIYRRGKWDLPKGKLEIGEDIKSCAIREVQDRKSTRLNSSHVASSYAVLCFKNKTMLRNIATRIKV